MYVHINDCAVETVFRAQFYHINLIFSSATNLHNVELMLTDGWYFIKATIDNMLSKLVYDGKIVVGNKIVTCGAELVNCEQGIAPWEVSYTLSLLLLSFYSLFLPEIDCFWQ